MICLGNRESQSYNEGVFKNNLKHAILGQIRAPPEGFSLVTRSHFFHKRESLLKVSLERERDQKLVFQSVNFLLF